MRLAIFAAVSVLSSLLSSAVGFGGAPVSLTLGSLLLPVKDVVAISTVGFVASAGARTWLYRRQLDWGTGLWMGGVSTPFSFIGARLMLAVPGPALQRVLATVVVGYVFADRVLGERPRPLTPGRLTTASALYGFLSGFVGTGQVVKVAVLSAAGFRKERFVGTMAATSLAASAVQLATYLHAGLLKPEHTPVAAALVAGSLASALIGRAILGRMTHTSFKTAVQATLLLVAAVLYVADG